MAEGGEHEILAASLGTGSEEAFEFVCKPCQRDNQYVEGIGYCGTCAEYLCATCFSCHKKSLVSRDHALLDKTNILQQNVPPPLPPKPKRAPKPKGESNSQGSFARQCPKHDLEFTKFYCNEHSSLACSVCLAMDHKLCEDASYIPDISDGIVDSGEFKEVFGELKTLKAVLKYENRRESHKEKQMEDIHKATIDGMLAFKEEVSQIVDNLCSDVAKSAMAVKDAEAVGSTNWLKRYNGLITEIDKSVQDMETHVRRANCNELFICMKTAKAQISSLRERVQRLSHENQTTQYKFEGNAEITERLVTVTMLGKIVKRNPDKVTAKLLHSIDVKSDKDMHHCNITAAIVLPDGDIILSDHQNRSIKIVSPSQKKITTQLLLESEPFDITIAEDDKLVVALTNVDIIQILKLTDNGLVKQSSFETTDTCVGIEYHDGKIIAVCQDPGSVVIMDMGGKVLQKMEKDGFGNALFTKPRSIALSVDKSVIYLTEPDIHKVVALNFDGEILAEHQREDGRKPTGIALESDDVVYVCYGDSHAMHRLSPTCRHLQILLSQWEGCPKNPWAIALDKNRDLLYVGSASGLPAFRNFLKVFKLEYDWN